MKAWPAAIVIGRRRRLCLGDSAVPRMAIAVAPVINQTGFTSLQPFQPALTYLLTNQLGDSDDVRVLPYGRLVQITRRFAFEGVDLSSRAVIETISATTDAKFVLVPTLMYDNGVWRGRLEIRAPDTGTNVHEYITAGVTSSLEKDAAFGLVRDLAAYVQEHFQSPRSRLRRWLRLSDRSSRRRYAASVRSLDAAAQVEQGLRVGGPRIRRCAKGLRERRRPRSTKSAGAGMVDSGRHADAAGRRRRRSGSARARI